MHSNVELTKEFNATVDKVWEAITNNTAMKEWYYDVPDFEAKEGYNFSFYGNSDEKYHHFCEVLEVIPQEKLKHSWSYPELSKEKTIITWELEDKNGQTVLHLKHKGLETLEHLGVNFRKENFEKEWTEILQSLKDYLEK